MTVSRTAIILDEIRNLREQVRPFIEMAQHHEQTLYHGNGHEAITTDLATIKNDISHLKDDVNEIKVALSGPRPVASSEVPTKPANPTQKEGDAQKVDWWKWSAAAMGTTILALLGWLIQQHLIK